MSPLHVAPGRALYALRAGVLTRIDAGATGTTGGQGGSLANITFQSFTSGGVTGQYHLYASDLDWTKRVGILIYTDGSGDWGLNNLSSTYLMAGTNGLINVAKRNNMILLTPLAPGAGCPDGEGVCWYMTSSGYTPTQKAQWSRDIIDYIYGRYDIDLSRVAFGGYSSGAQWTTQYFGPAHAADIMDDGIAVAISYGGEPLVTPEHTTEHKAAVPYVWDTGDEDSAYTTTSIYGVKAGKAWYDSNGFTTDLVLTAGLGHSRSDFGLVMEREIVARVPPA